MLLAASSRLTRLTFPEQLARRRVCVYRLVRPALRWRAEAILKKDI